jgi:hypothetical protein
MMTEIISRKYILIFNHKNRKKKKIHHKDNDYAQSAMYNQHQFHF